MAVILPEWVPSLAGTSALYQRAHVRVLASDLIRYQWVDHIGHGREKDRPIKHTIFTDWLAKQDHNAKSYCSNAKYVRCQIRKDTPGIRMQIAGTPFNRTWGAVVYLPDAISLGKPPTSKPPEISKAKEILSLYPNKPGCTWQNWGETREEAVKHIYNGLCNCKACGASWILHVGFLCPGEKSA